MPQPMLSGEACDVIATSVHVVAIGMAVFRLGYRYRSKLRYWDDLWAACCLVSDLGLLAMIWLWSIRQGPTNSDVILDMGNAQIWLSELVLPCAVWTSRISVAFSVYRIAEVDILKIRLLTALICALILTWIAIMLNSILIHFLHPTWNVDFQISSGIPRAMTILFFVLAIAADVCLITIPLHLLRDLRLSKTDRLLVRMVFSCSILSSMAVVIRVTFDLGQFGQGIAIHELVYQIRGAVALVVCNLNVVLPCIYRLFRKTGQHTLIMPTSIGIVDLGSIRISISSPSRAGRGTMQQQYSQDRLLVQSAPRISSGRIYGPGIPLSEPQSPEPSHASLHKLIY